MSKKILIVDDEIMNLKMAQFILSKKDYQVFTASSGEEGLTLLAGDTFDLLLLDIEMPGICGFDIISRVMSDEKIKNIPILILSCSCDKDDYDKAIEMGACGFVKKPFLPDDLISAVEDLI